ncbi:uncharacterized protein LOC127747506 [Arachis duranensis]|uniref:Uncharacterized protein LOC127743839 n=1 Tax=Arachis duranensis TaxID=130453 RepID=A0A9C6WTE0_ARADU|nr:uncharacterized protein LOC127743839 [Arachis duranensis]XP_052117439.1 uncharacterized protein LOC127747506 [Arachis duranensis]
MSVTDYTNRFEKLCRFSRICHGAPEDFEEWKCIKYEGGMRSDILSTVGPMEIRIFSELVNNSRVVDDCARKAALDKGDHRTFNNFRGFNNNNNQRRGKGRHIWNPPNNLTCRRCGAYHPNSPCRARVGVCYYCGGAEHLSWNCPERKRQEAEKVQQQRRVFTISADGAERSDTLIRGKCEIGGTILIALFDTRASHSFISFEKANELGLKITMLTYDLHVHTLASETVVTRLGCQQVPFRIKHRIFVHDLICLPMTGLDLILGLDWLSKNHVLLDCFERSL